MIWRNLCKPPQTVVGGAGGRRWVRNREFLGRQRDLIMELVVGHRVLIKELVGDHGDLKSPDVGTYLESKGNKMKKGNVAQFLQCREEAKIEIGGELQIRWTYRVAK